MRDKEEDLRMRRRLIATAISLTCLLMFQLAAQAQTTTYRGTFQNVRRLIERIENRSATFQHSLRNWASRNPNQVYAPVAGEDIDLYARDLNESVRTLRDRFQSRQATSSDVQDLLNRAARIDVFLGRHSVDARTRNQWSLLRGDLNRLATAFNVSWPRVSNYPPYGNPQNQFGNRLTGTYRVDLSRSDDARVAAERASRGIPVRDRSRVLNAVTRRLDVPDQLALDVRGRNVMIASTRAAQISFVADGIERTETSPSGRTIRSRASLSGDQLLVSTTGDRGNDFSVTFDSIDGGQGLNVTRSVYVQGLNSPVIVRSTYHKTSEVARFDIYDPRSVPSSTIGDFVVTDGTRIVGTLENTLSTRSSQVGDRFTMRVTSPNEFLGAIIEGHVSQVERSGRLTGRSVLTLDFDSIRLRNGRSYQFAGIVEAVREADGDIVRVDTEGAVRDSSQTSRTTTRTAIGTAVGALIGAIAGGGRGAAIGAIIGAGGGAGSVYVEGRNDLELRPGTDITVRAGAPR